jgi:chromosome segregation ATPase
MITVSSNSTDWLGNAQQNLSDAQKNNKIDIETRNAINGLIQHCEQEQQKNQDNFDEIKKDNKNIKDNITGVVDLIAAQQNAVASLTKQTQGISKNKENITEHKYKLDNLEKQTHNFADKEETNRRLAELSSDQEQIKYQVENNNLKNTEKFQQLENKNINQDRVLKDLEAKNRELTEKNKQLDSTLLEGLVKIKEETREKIRKMESAIQNGKTEKIQNDYSLKEELRNMINQRADDTRRGFEQKLSAAQGIQNSKIQELERKIQDGKTTSNQHDFKILTQESQITNINDKIEKIRMQKVDIIGDVDKNTTKINDLDDRFQRFEKDTVTNKQIISLEKDVNDMRKIISELKIQLTEMQNEQKRTSSELAEVQNEQKRTSSELAEVKNNQTRTSSELAEVKNEQKRTSSELTQVKNNQTRTSSELAEVKNEQKVMTKNLDEKMNTIDKDLAMQKITDKMHDDRIKRKMDKYQPCCAGKHLLDQIDK